ncbi:MAG: NTP transferase domain-containing protein [Solirubrobacterales bacterium]|nr:NTP transferase domain-containing protein [Solirubrobacterales bacterium]
MAPRRPLVVILAGGAGGRLELLTRERAKPAVPFGGTHRLIDFPMSNCRNAGLSDVWISQQFNPVSLSDHLSDGRPWDLDRTTGGLLTLQPRLGHDGREGFQQGTADGLWKYAPLIRDLKADSVVVLSADAVYSLDYGAVIDEHLEADADVTMVTTEVEPDDAGRYGVLKASGGRVREYVLKPDEPDGNLVCSEVFVFRPSALLDTLEEIAAQAGEDGLKDLGHELLPRLVDAGGAHEYRFSEYWRDVGTVQAYWESHQELIADTPPIDLDDPAWPMLTQATSQRAPAHVQSDGTVKASLLAPGARVAGSVERSMIGRGAVVEAGAVVSDSVVLPGAIIRAGASLQRAILDDAVEISWDATVGEKDGDIALIGLRAVVEAGASLPGGARFPADDDGDSS